MRERQARRNAERSDKRRTVRTEDAEDGESRDDSRWVRDDTRGPFRDLDEVRRPTREAPVRGTRKRADPADEEDGEVVVRSQRSRDGRERAVYEEPRRERQLETRTLIREEAPRPRIPFIFDLFGGGNSD